MLQLAELIRLLWLPVLFTFVFNVMPTADDVYYYKLQDSESNFPVWQLSLFNNVGMSLLSVDHCIRYLLLSQVPLCCSADGEFIGHADVRTLPLAGGSASCVCRHTSSGRSGHVQSNSLRIRFVLFLRSHSI